MLQQLAVGRRDGRGTRAVEDFCNQHGESGEAHVLPEESATGWTALCSQTNKEKQNTAHFIIDTQREKNTTKHPQF